MNKLTKRILSVFLAVAMIVTILPQVATTQAATKKSIVLYKGEKIYYTDYSAVKSVKSSNSKIVKASKDKSNTNHANMVAKKAGKANVNISTRSGKTTIAVTVRSAKFEAKLLSANAGGNILVSVKNKSKDTFDKVTIKYTIKDLDGGVIAQKSETMSYLLAGKVAYTNIYVGSSNLENIDLSQSSVKVTEYDRTWLGYTYTDVSSKVKATPEITDENESSVSYNIKLKNGYNSYVYGKLYTMIYDANDNLIGVESSSISLDKKEIKTLNYGYFSKRYYPNYDHMKLVVNAYATKRDNKF